MTNQPILHLPTELITWLKTLPDIDYIGAGTANQHWRLTCGSQRYIWRERIHHQPGSSQIAERLALQCLDGRSWAPKVCLYLEEGILFYDQATHTFDPQTLTPSQRQHLLQSITELWQIPFQGHQMNYTALIKNYADLAGHGADTDALASSLLAESYLWRDEMMCFIHQDIHPGNLLLSNEQVILIDWEYATRGNPWIDAIALQRMLQLTQTERQFLMHYLPTYPAENAWSRMSLWLTQLDALWSRAQTKQSC
jgi:thiamine kinase